MNPPASATTGVSEWLINQGALGVALILAILVIMRLWARIEEKDKQIAELQDKRVSDSNAYGQKMEQVAEGAVKAVRRLSRALDDDSDDGKKKES